MAAELYNRLTNSQAANSAGTSVATPGQSIAERALESRGAANVIKVMSEEGIDISNNIQQQVTKSMLDDCEQVIVMAEPETIPEFVKGSPKYLYWYIEDPALKDLDETRATKESIKSLINNLIKGNKNE